MPIELIPPTIYATPGELADAYMPEVEKAWRERPAFALRAVLLPPEQVAGAASVFAVVFWGQVQQRLPAGWGVTQSVYDWATTGAAYLQHGVGDNWPDHDAWAS